MGPVIQLDARDPHRVGYRLGRFYLFVTMCSGRSQMWRHVNVVELKRGTKRLPLSIRGREVRQVLLRTEPLLIRGGGRAWEVYKQAEEVLEKLERMTLSMQVADYEGMAGVKELFDHLWELETCLEKSC
jgi:hypothetical protein